MFFISDRTAAVLCIVFLHSFLLGLVHLGLRIVVFLKGHFISGVKIFHDTGRECGDQCPLISAHDAGFTICIFIDLI